MRKAPSCRKVIPSVLRQVVDLIGLRATLKLVKHHGGTHLRLPRRFRTDCDIALLLGPEAASKLIRQFSGATLYVSKMDDSFRQYRNQAIVRDYEDGVAVSTLAKIYSLSDRQVWNILSAP